MASMGFALTRTFGLLLDWPTALILIFQMVWLAVSWSGAISAQQVVSR